MHLAKFNVDLFLTKKRERKASKRSHLLKLRQKACTRATTYNSAKRGIFGGKSAIANLLCKSANKQISLNQTSLRLNVPSKFSMLTSPEAALELICSFALTHQKQVISDIYIDFSAVISQDLGAHALLDKLVDEMVLQTKVQNSRVGWKGTFPNDPAQRRFIAAMGVVSQLGLSRRYLNNNEEKKIHRFERKCRHYVRALKPIKPEDKSEQANAAERFADHVNTCLASEGRALSNEGRSKLCTYVAEIIDNAECHAGMVDWTIQGYVDMAMDEPECEIVIFNFGKSIAETFEDMPLESYPRVQIQKYLDIHTNSGWFSHKWRSKDLLTLIALQGSVSTKNESEFHTRGQGTADLIQFFQQMNDERELVNHKPASMYIISGSTKVIFDPKYKIVHSEDGSRIIAFNDSNDLNLPPDQTCVTPLLNGCHLPGTMIGIKFAVKAAILQ